MAIGEKIFSGLVGAGGVVGGQSLQKIATISSDSGTLLDEARASLNELTEEFLRIATNLEVVSLGIRESHSTKAQELSKDFDSSDRVLAAQFANKGAAALIRYWEWNHVLHVIEKNNPDVNIWDIKTAKRNFDDLKLAGLEKYNATQLSRLRMTEEEVEGINNYLSNTGNLRMAAAIAGYYQDLSQSNNVILTTAIKILGLQTRYNEISMVCDLMEPHSQRVGDQVKVVNLEAFKDKFRTLNDYQVALLSYLVNEDPSANQDTFGRPSNALNSNLDSVFMRSMHLRFSMQREMYEHIGIYVLENWDKNSLLPLGRNHAGEGEKPYTIQEYFSEEHQIHSKSALTKTALVDLMIDITIQDHQNRGAGREFDRIISANRQMFLFLLVTRMDLNPAVAALRDGEEISKHYKYKDGEAENKFSFPQGHATAGMLGLASLMREGTTYRGVAQDFGSIVESRHNPDFYKRAKLKIEKAIPAKFHKHNSHNTTQYYNLIGLGGVGEGGVDIELGNLGATLKQHFLSQPTVAVSKSFRVTHQGLQEIVGSQAITNFSLEGKKTLDVGSGILRGLLKGVLGPKAAGFFDTVYNAIMPGDISQDPNDPQQSVINKLKSTTSISTHSTLREDYTKTVPNDLIIVDRTGQQLAIKQGQTITLDRGAELYKTPSSQIILIALTKTQSLDEVVTRLI